MAHFQQLSHVDFSMQVKYEYNVILYVRGLIKSNETGFIALPRNLLHIHYFGLNIIQPIFRLYAKKKKYSLGANL